MSFVLPQLATIEKQVRDNIKNNLPPMIRSSITPEERIKIGEMAQEILTQEIENEGLSRLLSGNIMLGFLAHRVTVLRITYFPR